MKLDLSVIQFSAKTKAMFFDRETVLRDIRRKEARALQRIGAAIRRTARTMLRKRKRPKAHQKRTKASAPGKPPFAYEEPGLRSILYYYDADARSVVIGPIAFNGTKTEGTAKTVPELLEFGGTSRITESRYSDREMGWHPGKWQQGSVETRERSAKYKARPFMGPALDDNERFIMDAFKDT